MTLKKNPALRGGVKKSVHPPCCGLKGGVCRTRTSTCEVEWLPVLGRSIGEGGRGGGLGLEISLTIKDGGGGEGLNFFTSGGDARERSRIHASRRAREIQGFLLSGWARAAKGVQGNGKQTNINVIRRWGKVERTDGRGLRYGRPEQKLVLVLGQGQGVS